MTGNQDRFTSALLADDDPVYRLIGGVYSSPTYPPTESYLVERTGLSAEELAAAAADTGLVRRADYGQAMHAQNPEREAGYVFERLERFGSTRERLDALAGVVYDQDLNVWGAWFFLQDHAEDPYSFYTLDSIPGIPEKKLIDRFGDDVSTYLQPLQQAGLIEVTHYSAERIRDENTSHLLALASIFQEAYTGQRISEEFEGTFYRVRDTPYTDMMNDLIHII